MMIGSSDDSLDSHQTVDLVDRSPVSVKGTNCSCSPVCTESAICIATWHAP